MKSTAPSGGVAARIAALIVLIAAALAAPLPTAAQDLTLSEAAKKRDAELRRALARIPATIDASPLPDMQGDFVSQGADGAWRRPGGSSMFLYSQMMNGTESAPMNRMISGFGT